MRSDKMSLYRCCGLFLAESITLKSKHGIQVLNETSSGRSQDRTLDRIQRLRQLAVPGCLGGGRLADTEVQKAPPHGGSCGLDLWILPNFLDLTASR